MSFAAKAAERLGGKTVLITGASSGIGEATALELASTTNGNIRLILAARRLDKLENLKAKLESQHKAISVLPQKLDVSDYKKVPNFLNDLPKAWSQIDVLVNNAGLALGRDHVGGIKSADLEAMLFTNVLGMIALTNAIVPQFKQQNSGDIVMIGSIAGRDAYPGGSVYCASKSALRSFSSSLRAETINTGIRVLEVDPGAVETEFSIVRYYGDKAQADGVYEGTEPLTATDIAETIVFGLSRRPNVVIAESLVFPTHQAGASHVYRKK